MVTSNLGTMCKSILPNYDPLVVTPIYNLVKDSYNKIISISDPSINPRQELSIEINADYIIDNNANELNSILLMMAMMFDKQKYSKRGGYKTRHKRHSRKSWNTKKKNRLNNYRLKTNKNRKSTKSTPKPNKPTQNITNNKNDIIEELKSHKKLVYAITIITLILIVIV